MKTMVAKEWLMAKVNDNRKEHRALFLKAVDGFRKVAMARFEKNITLIKKGGWPETYFNIAQPQDMTKEYDRVLQMLAAHTEEAIEISSEDYAHFVQDDWEWKAQVFGTNSTYASGSCPGEE